MDSKRKQSGLALVAAGLATTLAGIFAGKAGSSILGLSSDFWSGFVMAVGIALAIAGIALLIGRDPRE